MKDKKIEMLIKILVSIIFIVLTSITSFNVGKKFYELKNTFINNNKKVNIGLDVAEFDFKVNFMIEDEVIKIE